MEMFFIYFISYCFEEFILLIYLKEISLKNKHSQLYNNIFISALYVIMLFAAYGMNSQGINAICYAISTFIIFITQYYTSFGMSLFNTMFLTAVMSTCELLGIGAIQVFNPLFLAYELTFTDLLIHTLLSKVIFLVIIISIGSIVKKRTLPNTKFDRSIFFLLFIPISSIFVMITILNISQKTMLDSQSSTMVIVCSIILMLGNIFTFVLHYYNQNRNLRLQELNLIQQKNDDLANYYSSLKTQYDQQRYLIHDIKNHLLSLRELNEIGDKARIEDYIDKLQQAPYLVQRFRLCGNDMMNAILARYSEFCIQNQIEFVPEIHTDTINQINDSDLTTIFCNILDNAVKAVSSANSKKKFIDLTITKKEALDITIIKLVNTCEKNPFDESGHLISSINRHPFESHGIGLQSVEKTIKKYNGDIEFIFNEEDLSFHTIIALRVFS